MNRPKHCLTVVLAAAMLGCASTDSTDEPVAQASFASPQEASHALVTAIRNRSVADFRVILGNDADDLLDSRDEVQFRNEIQEFLRNYDDRHYIEVGSDGVATLVTGTNDWPMPVPIVRDGERWRFDTARGLQEIANRQIGQNELDAIQTCRAIVDAQEEYRAMNPLNDGAYASKFFSDSGTKNGLYWPTDGEAAQSPLGEFVAAAIAEGYRRGESGAMTPYHGYFYRILTAQGPAAPGGARSYLANGKLTGGFAIVAWPAEYGQSGIMTFIVNHLGIVYERDLGDNTEKVAAAIRTFDPDQEWNVCEDLAIE